MTEKITRRSLTRGALWAAPTVIATTVVPAYAVSPSSPVEYLTDDVQGLFTGYSVKTSMIAGSESNDCYTQLTIDTTQYTPEAPGTWPLQPGFSIGTTSEEYVGKVATMESLYYYVAVPKELTLRNMLVGSGNWQLDNNYQGSADNFPYENFSGNNIFADPSYADTMRVMGYNFYRFIYTGNTRTLVLEADGSKTPDSSNNTWPGSVIKLDFEGSLRPTESAPDASLQAGVCVTNPEHLMVASGYVFSGTVETAPVPYRNRTLARKDRGQTL
ncbi:hypothetical protein [Rothia nasimurium]|uniref:hypothetical protein n=1 Tax=Rothia nasimurium TaxID=85336 RepID=UPI001F228C50|nr:hypothetical protein [Rothia nasimurium]